MVTPGFLVARITANDYYRNQRLYIERFLAQSMPSYIPKTSKNTKKICMTRPHKQPTILVTCKKKKRKSCMQFPYIYKTDRSSHKSSYYAFSKTIAGIVGSSKAFRICSRTHSSINIQRSFKTGDMPEVGSEGSHTKSQH